LSFIANNTTVAFGPMPLAPFGGVTDTTVGFVLMSCIASTVKKSMKKFTGLPAKSDNPLPYACTIRFGAQGDEGERDRRCEERELRSHDHPGVR